MFFKITQIAVPFVWFGMVGAISFLEAPLKFRAPNITTALGLGIGKIVFRALNRIEIFFAALMIASLFAAQPAENVALYLFGLISILLALQTVWLLPLLNRRAEQVIAGKPAPPSKKHLIYVAFEVLKFLLLLVQGVVLLEQDLKFE